MGKLTDAVQANNLTEVQKLLASDYKQSPLINEEKNKDGDFALYIASDFGYVTIIEALIKAGAKVNHAIDSGATPLYIASDNGHVLAVEILLKNGAKIDLPNNDGNTPLSIATHSEKEDVIEVLLKAGAKVDKPRNNGKTPLFHAIMNSDETAIAALVKARADVNHYSKKGKMPLFYAVLKDDVSAVELLLKAGAKIDQTLNDDIHDGRTTLFIAILNNNITAVKALIKAKADVNYSDKKSKTPLYAAVTRCDVPIVKILLKAGAKIDQTLNDGYTALFASITNIAIDIDTTSADLDRDRMPTIITLLNAKADVNHSDKKGRTPLFFAAHEDSESAAKLLIQAKADINKIDESGETPLHSAAHFNSEKVFKFLIQAKADINHTNKDGKTPLDIAREKSEDDSSTSEGEHFSDTDDDIEPPSVKTIKNFNLLQVLQAEQLKQKPVKRVPFSKAQPNSELAPKPTIDVIIQTLQCLEKEKEELGKVSTLEIQQEAQQLQKQLQRELNTQKQAYQVFEAQEDNLQQKIKGLEDQLSQKANVKDQEKIRADLDRVIEQLSGVKSQLTVLWNEHEVKAQKRAALQKFQGHPNLILFYRTLQIRIEEVFIGFKTVASGFVSPVAGNTATAATIVGCLGDVAGMIPIVGAAIDKVCGWTSKVLIKVDNKRQSSAAINASALVTLSEVQKYAESIARQLTECYAEQLILLASPDEAEVFDNSLQKGVKKAKELVLKAQSLPPAKQLAAFALVWIIDKLYEAEKIKQSEDLDTLLISQVTEQTPPIKIKEFWSSITVKLGLEGVRNKKGEVWHPEQVFILPGIKIKSLEDEGFQYYSGKTVQPEKFGWRVGTLKTVKSLKLKATQPPLNQINAIYDDKVHKSVSLVKRNMKKVEEKAQEHSKAIERMQKTGHVVEGAKIHALEERLDAERKEKEELVRRGAVAAGPVGTPFEENSATGGQLQIMTFK